MNEEPVSKILTHLRTQSEAQELLAQLDAFKATLYSIKKDQLQNYFSHLPKEIADAVIDALNDPVIKKTDDSLRTFISQLQDRIRACRTIQITLAFEPDDATVSFFSNWIKTQIGNNILLDIHVDRVVVGGAIIVANGQYKDYSVRKKLTQVFQIQREEILSLLSETR